MGRGGAAEADSSGALAEEAAASMGAAGALTASSCGAMAVTDGGGGLRLAGAVITVMVVTGLAALFGRGVGAVGGDGALSGVRAPRFNWAASMMTRIGLLASRRARSLGSLWRGLAFSAGLDNSRPITANEEDSRMTWGQVFRALRTKMQSFALLNAAPWLCYGGIPVACLGRIHHRVAFLCSGTPHECSLSRLRAPNLICAEHCTPA